MFSNSNFIKRRKKKVRRKKYIRLKTIKIKGKDYVEVKERVKELRKKNAYFSDKYSIRTNVIEIDIQKYVLMKASIYCNESGDLLSTGHAMEEKSEHIKHINTTSMVENCETSAVGRALGFLGIGIDAAIASADEIIKEKPKWWSDAIKYLNEQNGTIETIKKKYKLSDELIEQLKEDAING